MANEEVVYRTKKWHQRRIIAIEPSTLFCYCTGCAWYQAGDYAKIAVEWIEHTGTLDVTTF
jgi:hypothetical protein